MAYVSLPGGSRNHKRLAMCECCGGEETYHEFNYVRFDGCGEEDQQVVYNLYCKTPLQRFRSSALQLNKRMSLKNWNALMDKEIYAPPYMKESASTTHFKTPRR